MPAGNVSVSAVFEHDPVTVSGTATNIAGVQLVDKEDATKKYPAEAAVPDAETGAYSITNVPVGATYIVKVTGKPGYEFADSEVEITAAKDDLNLTATAITVPTLTGTVLADVDFSDNDTWGFVAGASVSGNPSVAVDNGILKLHTQNKDNYADTKTFGDVYTSSTDMEILFDFIPYVDYNNNRRSSFVVYGNDNKPIISIIQIGNGGVSYDIGKALAVTDAVNADTKIADNGNSTNKLRFYLHLVKKEDGGSTLSGYVFNVSGAEPAYLKTIPETSIEAEGLAKMSAEFIYSLAPMALDNIKITTHDSVIPVNVTGPDAADGTLKADTSYINATGTVTITPVAAAGKKIKAVKVNGNDIAAEEGKYTYTATESDEAVNVMAEFVRADVTAVTVSGAAMVQKGLTSQYTAVVNAGETDVTSASDITWAVEAAPVEESETPTTVASGTKVVDGLLTVDANQEEGNLVVKATVKKDITSDSTEDTNKVVGTAAVQIVAEPAYSITKSDTTNGSFVVKSGEEEVALAKENTALTVVATPATGYEVDTITVTDADSGNVTVSGTGFTMPGKAVTVTVTFKLTDYTITNSNATGTDKLDFKVGEGSLIGETGTATANMGQTITITPTVADASTTVTVTVTDTTASKAVATTKQEDDTYTFTMPAGNVTISADFVVLTTIYSLNIGTSTDADTNTSVINVLTDADDDDDHAVTAEQIASISVGDFGTGTERNSAVASLDGWGYMHGANTNMNNKGSFTSRQSGMGINKKFNAVYATGDNSGQPYTSLIFANIDDFKMPTTGKIYITFDAYSICNGTASKNSSFGLISSSDATKAPTVIKDTTVTSGTDLKSDRGKFDSDTTSRKAEMEFVYDVVSKAYTLSKDGTVVQSGTASDALTGIYMTPGKTYCKSAIGNLVIKATNPVTE